MGFFDFFRKNSQPSPKKMIKAAKKNDLESVISQLENGGDINSKDEKGQTPLMLAAGNNYAELLKILIEKGADINSEDCEGRNALSLAAGNGWAEIVKALLASGAQINARDKAGRSALIWASNNGWIDTVKLLAEAGAQIDAQDKAGVLALINEPVLPLPEAEPPWPEFAGKHDLSLVLEVKKTSIELEITASECAIDWGDGSGANEYTNIKEKNVRHKYPKPGFYAITVNAAGLLDFSCSNLDAKAAAIYLNNCAQLEHLTCSFNNLSALNVSRCKGLKSLFCSHNKLASLDLSQNFSLETLFCADNLLACLDISNNRQLNEVNCSDNQLLVLKINCGNALARLQCCNNQLSRIELNRVANQLPSYDSSRATVNSWSGPVSTPNVFLACGGNPGFDSFNRKIAINKNWLVWRKAVYILPTLAGTPGQWTESF
jgi:ankyrin repeat protein